MRVGGTVRRPGGPAAAQVRLFLAHLEQVGFDGAPRFHGFDDRNREILDYLERSTLSSLPPWGTCMSSAGRVTSVDSGVRSSPTSQPNGAIAVPRYPDWTASEGLLVSVASNATSMQAPPASACPSA
jgi:hypothetical protein